MPTALKYLDFDLELEPRDGKYVARVLASPGGEGRTEFALPFSDQDIEILLLKMGFSSARRRGRDASKLDAAKQFGGRLFATVFAGPVQRCWLTSLEKATGEGAGLRLRLRMNDAPELADLPWEFLFDATFDQFLNHSVETPLVRFLDLPAPPRALKLQPPLKILVVISLPSDWEKLAADQEWENMQRELQPLIERGLITLERTDQATLPALQRKLRHGEYNVLHFVGHGEYVAALNENMLLLENEQGQSKQVDGSTLGTLLLGHRSLRLVVLNACEGARANRNDPFGGVAQKLIQKGIPAVVAMQFAISDTAALKLSSEFYSALADNYPIDAALAEARRAIFFDDNAVEWATPVLYSRAPDGIIFDVQGAPQQPVVQSPPKTAASVEDTFKQARSAQREAEQILEENPNDTASANEKFRRARDLLERAAQLKPDDPRFAFHLGEVLAQLEPEDTKAASEQFRRAERLLTDPSTDDEKRLLANITFARATLTDPPNEKLLWRAGELADEVEDQVLLGRIEQAAHRLANWGTGDGGVGTFQGTGDGGAVPVQGTGPGDTGTTGFPPQDVTDPNWGPPGADDFNPIGRWNVQVQDMVGSRLFVEFAPNGMFQMMQQVGLYQVPVNGTWGYNPMTRQLGLQGVVNAFQPFMLAITINNALPNGYAAVGNDGIGYLLTRA